MLVVSDASPLNILIRIRYVDILPVLFGEVIVPPTVVRELSHDDTPKPVHDWIQASPAWLSVRTPSTLITTLSGGLGEREAISLAIELKADLILIDDLKARRAAERYGLSVTGALGVLERGAKRGLLSLIEATERLRRTDFRLSDAVLQEALERHAREQGR